MNEFILDGTTHNNKSILFKAIKLVESRSQNKETFYVYKINMLAAYEKEDLSREKIILNKSPEEILKGNYGIQAKDLVLFTHYPEKTKTFFTILQGGTGASTQ